MQTVLGVAEAETITGDGFTVRLIVVDDSHPAPSMALMVYMIENGGFAVTLFPVVLLKPVDGDQV